MNLIGDPIVVGHDPLDGRQIALTDVTLAHSGRRAISLEIGKTSVELDAEARRNLVKHLTDIDELNAPAEPIEALAAIVGVLPEPITATRDGGGSR